jgi:hypothetical protein
LNSIDRQVRAEQCLDQAMACADNDLGPSSLGFGIAPRQVSRWLSKPRAKLIAFENSERYWFIRVSF